MAKTGKETKTKKTKQKKNKRSCLVIVESPAKAKTIEKYLGKEAVVHPEHPSMAAEDFSAYLQKIKGAFLWLGTGFDGNPALHNAGFTIDETILESGITMMAAIAAEYLQPKQ